MFHFIRRKIYFVINVFFTVNCPIVWHSYQLLINDSQKSQKFKILIRVLSYRVDLRPVALLDHMFGISVLT